MNKPVIRVSSLLALTIAAGISLNVNAADNPWYIGASANFTDLDTIESFSTNQFGGASRLLDFETDDETSFGIHIGRDVITSDNGNTLSLELAYSESDHDIERVAFNGNNFSSAAGSAEGTLDIETILARAVYKFDLGNIKPYLGVGIGETEFNADARYGGSVGQGSQAQPPFATGDDSALAIELRAGIEYSFSSQLGVFLEYSETDVDDVNFSRLGGGPGGLANTSQRSDFDFDSINVGAVFRF